MRIAIGEFARETNAFCSRFTELDAMCLALHGADSADGIHHMEGTSLAELGDPDRGLARPPRQHHRGDTDARRGALLLP